MEHIPEVYLNEVNGGHLCMLLLSRVAEISKKTESLEGLQEQSATQNLFDYAQEKLGATSSTCYSRLRMLRGGGFLQEGDGARRGKGIVAYTITPAGEHLLKELVQRAESLLSLCKEISTNGEKHA